MPASPQSDPHRDGGIHLMQLRDVVSDGLLPVREPQPSATPLTDQLGEHRRLPGSGGQADQLALDSALPDPTRRDQTLGRVVSKDQRPALGHSSGDHGNFRWRLVGKSVLVFIVFTPGPIPLMQWSSSLADSDRRGTGSLLPTMPIT